MPQGRPKRQSPLDRFDANLSDAELLLEVAAGFVNRRSRRARTELRQRVGEAFRVPKKRQAALDVLESEHLWIVFRPEAQLAPSRLEDLSPMLRPSIVMACAALETFVADTAIARLGAVLAGKELPKRLLDIPLSVRDWFGFRERYERQQWGVRKAITQWIETTASTAPNRIGEVLSAVGLSKDWAARVDQFRGTTKGDTVRQLDDITERRNRIAHAADRRGSRRVPLTLAEAQEAVATVKSVAHALERHCASVPKP